MTERQKILALFFLLVGIVGAAFFVVSGNSAREKQNSAVAASSGARRSDDGAGNVTVAAAWQRKEDVLRLLVEVDTHSEDLSGFDPTRQIVLEDAQGTATPPTTIIPEGEGHHRVYTADFPNRDGEIRLVVRDLAGVARRELVW